MQSDNQESLTGSALMVVLTAEPCQLFVVSWRLMKVRISWVHVGCRVRMPRSTYPPHVAHVLWTQAVGRPHKNTSIYGIIETRLLTHLTCTPVEFRGDLWQEKTRVHGLSCGVVVCLILRSAVLVKHRLVTDRRAEGRTDTGPWLVPRMHSIAR